MRIVRLKSENFKGLKAVEITPSQTDPMVLVSGANGAGKSSVIDSIWAALDAAAVKTAGLAVPVRDGAETAEVTLDLGDLVVTRTWARDGSSKLRVEGKDGLKQTAPQTVLNQLMNKVTLDPLAFISLPETAQADLFARVLGIADKKAELDLAIETTYQRRTEVGRQRDQFPLQPLTEGPTEELSTQDIMQQLMAAEQHNRSIEEKKNERRDNEVALGTITNQMQALQAKFDQLVIRQRELEQELSGAEPKNVELIKLAAANLDVENRNRRDRARAHETNQQHQRLMASYDDLTGKLEHLRAERLALITSARFPVDGLTYADDGGLRFNGHPFSQISRGEQLRVATAVAMAMAPQLRVIRISDGSLLDQANLKMIQELAASQDFQVWCEVVDDSGKVGVYIEDGEVKGERA